VAFDYAPHRDNSDQWLFATVSYLGPSGEGHPRFAYVVNDITERRQAEEQVRQSREQLRALLARLQTLREDERTRIAREIHDELGQQLTGLKMDLRWIERHWEDSGDPRANALLDKVVAASGLVDATIKTVQRIATDLRPGVLDYLGLVTALRGELDRFQERTGIHCRLNAPTEEPPVPREVATAFFRIFQEALTNVARHAAASEVIVRFEFTDREFLLEVRDDGKGIAEADLQDATSLGLLGMRERVRLVGGEVTVAAGEKVGTVVTLRIPGGTAPAGVG
jgi:signal transduction histidine kinase